MKTEFLGTHLGSQLHKLGQEIDDWIKENFTGRGRALREQSDLPLDREPWMSMDEAKQLCVIAVIHFILREKARNV